MTTIIHQPVRVGDVVVQAAMIGLVPLASPMVVVGVDEERHGVLLAKSPLEPARTSLDGSPRVYDPGKFLRVS